MLTLLVCLSLHASALDDAARYYAGLPGRAESAFKKKESAPAWQAYARAMDELWAKAARKRLPAMEAFASRTFGTDEHGAVFYPFSGPDALTMLALFPNRDTYVMAALEPPGTVPTEATRLSFTGLAEQLTSLCQASFFVTEQMDRGLRGQVTDGVAPLLLIQLARMGVELEGFRYVELDDAGQVREREKDSMRASFGYNLSLELQLAGGRKLYYVSVNLDDSHMNKDPAFVAFIEGLSGTTTLLKSTSYMPHESAFSSIRDLVLSVSEVLVQDDSGVPWKFLATDAWSVSLFGAYKQPYGSFKFRVQPDLRQVFEKGVAAPLEFPIGYGAGAISSNLEVARRTHAAHGERAMPVGGTRPPLECVH
jgi:hypothetical protein